MRTKSLSLLLSVFVTLSASAVTLNSKVVEIKLFDGSKIDFTSEVKEVHLSNDSKFDYLELMNGENIYDTDIEQIYIELKNRKKLKIPTNSSSDNSTLDIFKSIRVIGGDGSGGG